MSPKEVNDPQRIATGLLPLLKEYTQKLRHLSRDARKIQTGLAEAQASNGKMSFNTSKRDFESMRFRLFRMASPVDDLIRQASQLASHGRLAPVTLLELSLRLAEFEATYRETSEIIADGLPGAPR